MNVIDKENKQLDKEIITFASFTRKLLQLGNLTDCNVKITVIQRNIAKIIVTQDHIVKIIVT